MIDDIYLAQIPKRTMTQLRQENLKLKQELEAKDLLMGVISHEIKNPLTTIRGYAEKLNHGNFEEGQIIISEVDEIVNLTDQLFNYTKLIQGKYVLTLEQLNLTECIKQKIESLELIYPGRLITFKTESVGEVEVISDKQALSQILANLLTNAIRYSTGEIKVELEVKKTLVILTIADGGSGIPQKVRKVIWEAFSKPSTKGLGLGLFIVKKLCDAAKIKISFVSSHTGTKFTLKIPKGL